MGGGGEEIGVGGWGWLTLMLSVGERRLKLIFA